MTSQFHTRRRGRFPVGLLAGSLLALAVAGSVNGQEVPAAPRPRKSVQIDNDPLKQRSAAQNIVFGQIVDVDEHRLILRESGGNADSQTTLNMSPESRIFIGDKPVRITDIPPSSRVKVYLRDGDRTTLDRVVVLNDDDPAVKSTLKESASPVGFGIILESATGVLLVAEVRSNGPADVAGIRAGDELLGVNGIALTSADGLFRATSRLDAGRAATVRIRRDGTERDLKVIADDEAAARDGVRVTANAPRTTVVDARDAPEVDTKVTPEVHLGATLGTATDGVAVVRLEKNSPLAKAGLKDGDRIRQVAGRNVLTPDSVFRVLNEFDGGAKVELVVLRENEEFNFSLTLPDDHQRVLVDGVEPTPAVDGDHTARGTNETHLLQRVRELEKAQVLQQRQIQYLYQALVDTRNQLGYPALSTAFPVLGVPAGINPVDGATDDGAGVNGVDGGAGTDQQGERQRRRRGIDIEPKPKPPAVPFPRR